MRYLVYAKILGDYLPERKATINDCKIEKNRGMSLDSSDRPEIPVRMKSFEYHNLEHGQRNFIHYSQKPVDTRNFESEYLISTKVSSRDIGQAIREAEDRFSSVITCLTLATKNRVVRAGQKRIRRPDNYYDFEIIAAYIKTSRQYIRIKLPEPLMTGRNFFPKPFPQGFLATTKKYLHSPNPIFVKGLKYLQEAEKMNTSGYFNIKIKILSLIKIIELISNSLGIGQIYDKNKKKFLRPTAKGLFFSAGKKLGVTNKNIKIAQSFWDVRNRGDIAHCNTSARSFVHFLGLNEAAVQYLTKYYNLFGKYPSYFL